MIWICEHTSYEIDGIDDHLDEAELKQLFLEMAALLGYEVVE